MYTDPGGQMMQHRGQIKKKDPDEIFEGYTP